MSTQGNTLNNSMNYTVELTKAQEVFYNLSPAELVEHALYNGEATLASNGALVAYTGKYTGRTPKDKYVVKDENTASEIWWENNQAMEPAIFNNLFQKAQNVLQHKKLYVVDAFGGADPKHRIAVRVICEKAWHALFIQQLLIRPTQEEMKNFTPEWQIIDLCMENTSPAEDQVRSDATIALDLTAKTVLIFGTQYAGEMKKSVFTILNYLLPKEEILSMHCSANIGKEGDSALFFGLSGTGKTTLSADPNRYLIGDDEHAWSNQGIFNFEGGCYAKCVNLKEENEPQIWNAIRFGSVLENVPLNEDRIPDYDDIRHTENTRCAYPLDYIEGAVLPSMGGHPKNVVFLTCDAFGVLPPISKLTPEQAMEYFLMGYTAKVAGTEAGLTEPQAVFSSCFGQPFLPLHPTRYAELLKKKIAEYGANVWLVNTGWSGGAYGEGQRMKLSITRALLNSALKGELENKTFARDEVFGLSVPTVCEGVPSEILMPRNAWKDKAAYDQKAKQLFDMFQKEKQKHS